MCFCVSADPNYLRVKSHNLEIFLQQLLFDVPSYAELLQVSVLFYTCNCWQVHGRLRTCASVLGPLSLAS